MLVDEVRGAYALCEVGKAIRFEQSVRWDRLGEIKRGPSPGVRPRKRSQRWTARSTDPLTSCLRSLFLHSFLLPSPLLPPPPPRCPTRDSVVLDPREDCPLRPRPRPQSSSPPPPARAAKPASKRKPSAQEAAPQSKRRKVAKEKKQEKKKRKNIIPSVCLKVLRARLRCRTTGEKYRDSIDSTSPWSSEGKL